MRNGHLHALVRAIRQIAGAGAMRGATDAQLLRRFVEQRDEDAFSALLQRHAPMVLGVCGRLLRDANDAEDALQATFLVLVRKARSISRPNLLANWLYGVARRTALAARTRAAKQHSKEKAVVDVATPDPSVAVVWADLRPVLDEEVSRLPTRYRVPFVLCYLEGRTNEEAAQLIGCPKGTVLSRLSWARERLRKRLTRRGLAPSATLLTATLSTSAIRAAVPPTLARGCVEAALAFTAGTVPATFIGVVSLANGVIQHMFWTKTLYVTAAVVIMGLVGSTGVVAWQSGRNPGDGPKAAQVKGKETREGPPKQDQNKKPDAKDGIKEVLVFEPQVRMMGDFEDFTGRTEAMSTVEIRSRLTGYLTAVHVKEGAEVKKGDLLFEIDPRLYQAEMDKADATLAQAQLRLRLAQNALDRAETLRKSSAISQDDVAKLTGERAEAEAGVRIAQANREIAALNLSYTMVTAPVTGTIGRQLLDVGNLVKANDSLFATIVTQGPIAVDFNIDERTALTLRRALHAGTPNAKPWSSLPVAMSLLDEKGFPHKGKVEFADSRVDPNTGTLRIRAVFPNHDGLLVPGLYCRVRLTTSEPHEVLVVPASPDVIMGFNRAPHGRGETLIVSSKNKVEVRSVQWQWKREGGVPGPEDQLVIKEGLKKGDLISLEVVNLNAGTTVNPRRVPMPEKSGIEP